MHRVMDSVLAFLRVICITPLAHPKTVCIFFGEKFLPLKEQRNGESSEVHA